MNPLHAYQQNRQAGPTRIDTILALYDEAIGRLQIALASAAKESGQAKKALHEARLAITGLAAGVDAGASGAANFLRLFEYVLHCLDQDSHAECASALHVMQTLRDGFQTIRSQALDLERSGAIPSLQQAHAMHATA